MNSVYSYISHKKSNIYLIRHIPEKKRGTVIFIPPFPSERLYTYITLNNWSKALYDSRFEVIKFDYRGIGESTGQSSDYSLKDWFDDCLLIRNLLSEEKQHIIIFGLRLGANFAHQLALLFKDDLIIEWYPLYSINTMLTEMLRFKIFNDLINNKRSPKNVKQQIDEIEKEKDFEIEGYKLNNIIWKESKSKFNIKDETISNPERCLLIINSNSEKSFNPDHQHIIIPQKRPYFWTRSQLLNPDMSLLFNTSIQWIDSRI